LQRGSSLIYNLTGNVVLQQKLQLHKGFNKVELDVRGLSRGVYICVFYKDGIRKAVKIVIKKA
jgi:hypothetical protein